MSESAAAVGTAPAEPVVIAANRGHLRVMGLTALVLGLASLVFGLSDGSFGGIVGGAVIAPIGAWILWRSFFAGHPLAFSRAGLSVDGKPPIPWEDIEALELHRGAAKVGKGPLTLGVRADKRCAWWQENKSPLLQMASAQTGYMIVMPLGATQKPKNVLLATISGNSPVPLVDKS